MFKKKLKYDCDWHLYSLKQISNKIPEMVELIFEDGRHIGLSTSMGLDYIKRLKGKKKQIKKEDGYQNSEFKINEKILLKFFFF